MLGDARNQYPRAESRNGQGGLRESGERKAAERAVSPSCPHILCHRYREAAVTYLLHRGGRGEMLECLTEDKERHTR